MNPTHSQSCLVSLFIGCNQSRPVIDHNRTLLGALRFTAASIPCKMVISSRRSLGAKRQVAWLDSDRSILRMQFRSG
jgi:hypothetical protein